jgi:hypothetical protein
MPLGLIARLRRYRRPAVVMAAGLIAAQALLAGLAGAQAALVLTPDLLTPDLLTSSLADFAVICHGDGGADSDRGTVPDPAKSRHPCCMSCTAGVPPATLPAQQMVARADRGGVLKSPALRATSILIAPRAVRAGPSQAPPSLA